MENIENAIIDNTVASEHPVLKQLKDRIAVLEAEVEKESQLRREWTISKLKYEERVIRVLTEALEDHDEDTIKHIAENLDIKLAKKRQYEVNVTFTIETEEDLDDSIDADWDFDFSVDHHAIADYSVDVIWSKVEEV